MFQKKLVGAMLAALGCASVSLCAATPVHIHAGRLGNLAPATLANRLGLGLGSTFASGAHAKTVRGTVKTRERQTFQGVPVYGRSLVVERDTHGNVVSAHGEAEASLSSQLHSVRPRLSGTQAQTALQAKLGQRGLAASNVRSELFVYPQAKGNARLAYRTSYLVTTNGRISRPTAIVDANTGEVLRHWDGLTTGRRPPGTGTPAPISANGPGGNEVTGLYHYDGSGAGHELLSATRIGNTCYLQDDEVATYNLAGGQRVTLWSFGCAGTNPAGWTSMGDDINGAYSPINDAHHFGGVVYDMYDSWFGAPPLKNGDGSPMQLHMWVHYGTNYENAFWDGSEMVFGDGDQYFYPFVVLDITGHEISHGFTEQHSGLEYDGQSGGMNNDFMTGADIVKPSTVPLLGMAALRDMCTPSNDGLSIDDASQYYDGLNVHYSSGVYNRAFCTLAKTAGWNTRTAFEVFHDANALYWGPEETFDSGACGVEQAATDRGYAQADVAAAFSAVGVTCR